MCVCVYQKKKKLSFVVLIVMLCWPSSLLNAVFVLQSGGVRSEIFLFRLKILHFLGGV